MSTPLLLELQDLTKSFGSLLANEKISFGVASGEIVGVLGENGAGKSTLMNMISGLLAPDSGEIRLEGQAVRFGSPADAAALGVGMVHQHFKLVGALTVAENLALGHPRFGKGRLKPGAMTEELDQIARQLGIELDYSARVDKLAVGEQQRVEILKALSRRPKLLILDEPTAVLSQDERPALFRLVAELAKHGTAVIIISHKLEDILQLCNRVVVMRSGRVVSVSDVAGQSREDLIRLLVGRDLPTITRPPQHAVATPKVLVSVERLDLLRRNGTTALSNVSFSLKAGEILALCGVDGNGQSELMACLAGLMSTEHGQVRYWFDPQGRPPNAAAVRAAGVCHIPEDRLRDGVVAKASLADNFLLTHINSSLFSRSGWLQRKTLGTAVEKAVRSYSVRTPGLGASMAQLSGGNQQKLVLARELHDDPPMILAAHPTRGLDVMTIAFVNNLLLEHRARGAGVLLASADLAEVWGIADRIMVMSAGKLYGPVAIAETGMDEVGKWMTAR